MVDEVPGMSEPTFRTISTLRISDLAKKFYVDFRGFRIDWEHRFEDGAPVGSGSTNPLPPQDAS
jgi:hypothetical protein